MRTAGSARAPDPWDHQPGSRREVRIWAAISGLDLDPGGLRPEGMVGEVEAGDIGAALADPAVGSEAHRRPQPGVEPVELLERRDQLLPAEVAPGPLQPFDQPLARPPA